MRLKKFVVAASLCAVAGGAMAEGYLAVAGGLASIPVQCPANAICHDKHPGAKVGGGLILTPNVALEANFISFWHSTVKQPDATRFEYAAYAVTGGVALRMPLPLEDLGLGNDQVVGVARLGVAEATVEVTSNRGFDDSGQSSHLYLGLGLECALTKNVALTLAYDRTSGETDGGNKGSLSLYSAGLKFQF
jgi:Outer membrane protein beta-barrel domain